MKQTHTHVYLILKRMQIPLLKKELNLGQMKKNILSFVRILILLVNIGNVDINKVHEELINDIFEKTAEIYC